MTEPRWINIRIKMLAGDEHSVKIMNTSCIGALKEDIAEKTGTPPNRQRIIFQGRMLNDSSSIASCGLQDGSVVHCVQREPPTNNSEQDNASTNSQTQAPAPSSARVEMHRAVTLFVAAASRLDNRQTSSITSDTTDPSISDMEALAANMEDLARGLANLPTSLRTVAQGLRTDNATDFEALEVDFRNASSALLRLGTAATRMSSARINWSTSPPRAVEYRRTRDARAVGARVTGGNSSGIVIPVSVNAQAAAGGIDAGDLLGNIRAQIENGLQGAFQTANSTLQQHTRRHEQMVNQVNAALGGENTDETATTTTSSTTTTSNNEGTASNNGQQATLQAQVISMVNRLGGLDGEDGDQMGGINANITINAQVTPNIHIRIVPPSLAMDPVRNNRGEEATFHTSNVEDATRRATGLSSDVIEQITASVRNNSETGSPIVIECENTDANGEVGRVIGEALTQTFDNLMNPQTAPREGVEVEEFTEEEDRILNGDPAPVRAPRAPTGVTFSKGPNATTFTDADLSQKLVDWLGIDIGSNPTLILMRSTLESILMREVIAVFNREEASENLQGLFNKIVMFSGLLEGAMPGLFKQFFGDEIIVKAKDDIDVIESNMSLLRHTLRLLKESLQNREALGKTIRLFAKKFVKLNCELFKNKNDLITHVSNFATADAENGRRREMLVCAMKMSLVSSVADDSINIDGYVMDVKKEEPVETQADDGLEEDEIDSDNDDMIAENSPSTSQSVTSSNSSSAPSSRKISEDKPKTEPITEECLPKEWRPIVSRDAHIVREHSRNSSRKQIKLSAAYRAGMPSKRP